MDLPPPAYSPFQTQDNSTSSEPAPVFPSGSASADPLPSFARRTTETLPPQPWTLFQVGYLRWLSNAEPLEEPYVTVEAAKSHLVFLEAFRRLKLRVEQHHDGVTAALSPEDRWLVFLHVATERFTKCVEMWAHGGWAGWDLHRIMPLDCLLVLLVPLSPLPEKDS